MEGTASKSEEIKQHEIITILGNRVGAEKVPMLAIDVTKSVFSPGIVRVVIEDDVGGHWRVQQ